MGLTRIMFAILALKTHHRIPLTKDKQTDAAKRKFMLYLQKQSTNIFRNKNRTEPTAAAKQISGIHVGRTYIILHIAEATQNRTYS